MINRAPDAKQRRGWQRLGVVKPVEVVGGDKSYREPKQDTWSRLVSVGHSKVDTH